MKEENSNGLHDIIAQAIEEMKHEQGKNFSLEKINLAELQRRTGVSRAKLRRLRKNDFALKPHGLQGRKAAQTVLTGYTASWTNSSFRALPTLRYVWSGSRRQGIRVG